MQCDDRLARNCSPVSKEKQPHAFNIENLSVAAGMKTLSVLVDGLMDIDFHFNQSVNRRETLKEFEVFTDVEHMQVLKHCPTRQFSLRVVGRVLSQYPALMAYFTSHDDVEKAGRVKRAMDL